LQKSLENELQTQQWKHQWKKWNKREISTIKIKSGSAGPSKEDEKKKMWDTHQNWEQKQTKGLRLERESCEMGRKRKRLSREKEGRKESKL